MNKTDLERVAKAVTANTQSGESWLNRSNIDSRECALIDLITSAYYAGRAAMAANIYDAENKNSLGLSKLPEKLLDDCVEQTRYFR